MNIAIVEDLPADRLELTDFIARYCAQNHIYARQSLFESGEAFLRGFSPKMFDLIFLDIFMDGLDGMDTAQQIRLLDKDCLLVFSTTSEHHAVQSFRVRAFDYLVKPFSYGQFEEVMGLCEKALLRHARYIEVKESRERVRILLRDIAYADYSNHYVLIHTTGRVVRTYMPFQEFAALLSPYPQFLVCYRNCLVNLEAVSSMEERDFVLFGGERVPIARALRQEVRRRYAEFAFSRLDGGEGA